MSVDFLSDLWRQVQGGDKISEGVPIREPSLRPPFCRQGSKYLHRKDIIPVIPRCFRACNALKRSIKSFPCSLSMIFDLNKA
jgi:hypothetical protein